MPVRSFVAFATFLILTTVRIADIATTLHFDPSLSHEGHPVVFFFGGKAPGLITSSTVAWLTCIVLLYFFWRGECLKLVQSPKRLRRFARIWFDRVIRTRRPIKDTLPGGSHWNEGSQALRLFGLALPWAIIFGSITAVYSWFAIQPSLQRTSYQQLYATLQVNKLNHLPWLCAIPGFVVGMALFFWCEYHQHLRTKVLRRAGKKGIKTARSRRRRVR